MAYNALIVDDSAAMRVLIRKVLTISGFEIGSIFEGANGREALNLLEGHRADIILCNLHMPEMDGSAFLQTLRAHSRWRSLPVVLITADSRPDVVEPLLKCGVQAFIKKPFQPETIRHKLMAILGEAAAPDARELEGCDF